MVAERLLHFKPLHLGEGAKRHGIKTQCKIGTFGEAKYALLLKLKFQHWN